MLYCMNKTWFQPAEKSRFNADQCLPTPSPRRALNGSVSTFNGVSKRGPGWVMDP